MHIQHSVLIPHCNPVFVNQSQCLTSLSTVFQLYRGGVKPVVVWKLKKCMLNRGSFIRIYKHKQFI
jgi:hypothetical protein